MSVFVDTSAFLAVLDADDEEHEVSFAVMRRLGIKRVFCFDPHFREQGFESLSSTTVP